jgi:DNA processing protein
MNSELVYQVSLTLIPHIGPVQTKTLLEHFNSAASIFAAKTSQLQKIDGIGEARARAIRCFTDFSRAEEEVKFIGQHGITPLFMTDPIYPQRLLNCPDAPALLYYKGSADLNTSKIIAVVGTRNNTAYGKQLAEQLIKELSDKNVLIISGLAFGIDAIAHKAALKNEMVTIGVLAHGLDQLYPTEHNSLAKEMIRNRGGLITEFRKHTKPDKHNFPIRNRIVSGMSDAIVVVETGEKGGSMITAELANGYNRDVFAFPGRVNDVKSIGCNSLIKNNKAILLTGADQLQETMNWIDRQKPALRTQKTLFIELSEDEKKVLNILSEKANTHIDELNIKTGLSASTIASVILNLELQNVIVSLPGKLYQLS